MHEKKATILNIPKNVSFFLYLTHHDTKCQYTVQQTCVGMEMCCNNTTQHRNFFVFVFSWVTLSHVFSHTVHWVQEDCQYSAFIFHTNCMTVFIFLLSLSVIAEMDQRTWQYHC